MLMQSTETKSPPACPPSETNWPAFVDVYGRTMLEWFRQAGLPASTIEELVQSVFEFLNREFARMRGDPAFKFRLWLQFAGRAAWGDLIKTKVTAVDPDQRSPVNDLLLSESAYRSFLGALDRECTHQRRREVLPRIQAIAHAADWDIFYQVKLEGIDEAKVAEQIHGSLRSVRAAVFRVFRSLEDELKRIEESF